MNKKLFIAWQDPITRAWRPVGRLSFDGKNYTFVYTRGARDSSEFMPFPRMQNLTETYHSDKLFPIFANRVLNKARPEYSEFVHWLNLPSDGSDIDILARSGGVRRTDCMEVFPCPEPDASGAYHVQFFCHGIRHVPREAQDFIRTRLNPGDHLFLLHDLQNRYDSLALALRSEEPLHILGYCPRYLAADLHQVMGSSTADTVEVIVEAVNRDAPLSMLLLCSLRGSWPEGFSPCSDEAYWPIVDQDDSCTLKPR